MSLMLRHRIDRLISYHLTERLPQQGLALARGNGLSAYWFRETLNFGDLLTPAILRHHGFTPVHAYPDRAQLTATGSVLEHLSEQYRSTILGSGFIDARSTRRFTGARIVGLRGALSRDRIEGVGDGVILGDPGLYATRLLLGGTEKRPTLPAPSHAFGLVAHHAHLDAPEFAALKARHGAAIRVISPAAPPARVIAQIATCERIASASLHGLIAADALGLPAIWLAAPGLIGGRFKFDDYASAVARRVWNPVALTGSESLADLRALASCAPQDAIDGTIAGLARAFTQFAEEVAFA